ncbi:MAG TPA: hypothetical protein VGK03_02520 [Geothrix sp.]|jgi:hypothetical protein
MWRAPVLLALAGALGAQSLRIAAVERKGLPPYETTDRIYLLDGGQDRGLRVGQRLSVRRPGEQRPLGHLRVTEVRSTQAETHFESAGGGYPVKGDLVWREVLVELPAVPALDAGLIPVPPRPGVAPEAPPREGLLFFLPQRADLSPVGQQKLQAWVETWGAAGRWIVQVPASKALKPALQKQRAESLLAVLRSLGIERVKVDSEPRSAEGKYDPAWIRHWD